MSRHDALCHAPRCPRPSFALGNQCLGDAPRPPERSPGHCPPRAPLTSRPKFVQARLESVVDGHCPLLYYLSRWSSCFTPVQVT